MENLTLETLPKAFCHLSNEVGEIKRLLLKRNEENQSNSEDQLLTVQETAKFMSLAVPTIYSMVSRGELPVMKRSKRLYFSRVELLEYLKKGKKKLVSEIEADTLLKKKKGNK